VVRFQNNNEKWIAFVGLVDGRPYEIFTGIVDDDVLPVPKSVERGKSSKIKMKKETPGTTSSM
jgi:ribonucleoside-diphosphate reductase alpha chain